MSNEFKIYQLVCAQSIASALEWLESRRPVITRRLCDPRATIARETIKCIDY